MEWIEMERMKRWKKGALLDRTKKAQFNENTNIYYDDDDDDDI